MLILTRKVGEVIRIGDEIAVAVIEIRGNQVRLGVTAPREISVHRQEVYDLIQEQNKLAAQASASDKVLIQSIWRKKAAPERAETGGQQP